MKASTVRINPSNFQLCSFKYAGNILNESSFYLVQNSRKKITQLANLIVSGNLKKAAPAQAQRSVCGC